MRKSKLFILIAMLLCIAMLLIACGESETPPADNNNPVNPPAEDIAAAAEAAKKDAVVNYLTPADGGNDTTEMPTITMPEMQDVSAGAYNVLKGFALNGALAVNIPGVVEGMEMNVALKDGIIYLTNLDGSNGRYMVIDNGLNLTMLSEGEEGIFARVIDFTDALAFQLEDVKNFIPEEGITLPTLPDPTAEDLVVEGNRVSFTTEYLLKCTIIIAKQVNVIMGGTESEPPAEVVAQLQKNLEGIDLYFTLNTENKINGFGMDAKMDNPFAAEPAAEAPETTEVPGIDIKIAFTIDPTTNYLTSATLKADVMGAKVDIAVAASAVTGYTTSYRGTIETPTIAALKNPLVITIAIEADGTTGHTTSYTLTGTAGKEMTMAYAMTADAATGNVLTAKYDMAGMGGLVDFDYTATYVAGVLTTATATLDASIPATTTDETTAEIPSTIKIDAEMKVDLTGTAENPKPLFELTASMNEKVTATGAPCGMDMDALILVEMEETMLNIIAEVTAPNEETPEEPYVFGSVFVAFDLTTPPVIPEMSETLKDVKVETDAYIGKLPEIVRLADAMEYMPIYSDIYDLSFYYYSEVHKASFIASVTADSNGEYSWSVEYYYAPEAEAENQLVINENGEFEIVFEVVVPG